MAGRRASGWVVVLAMIVLVAAAALFWGLGQRTVEEAGQIDVPRLEMLDPPGPAPAPDPDPLPAPTPGPA